MKSCGAASPMHANSENPIVLYDGVCGLCNRSVQFILRHDHADRFRFAALQSAYALKFLTETPQGRAMTTVYLLTRGPGEDVKIFSKSDAAIGILAELGGMWSIGSRFLGLVPRPWRDWGYDFIARNRYEWFGRYDACPLPDPKDRAKFLDLP